MKKLFVAVLCAAAFVVGLQPAEATVPTKLLTVEATTAPVVATVPLGADRVVGSPGYTGTRYLFKDVCLHDVLMSSSYNVGWTGNQWESGDALMRTGYRTSSQGCADFPAWQRMRFYFYSSPDDQCAKITGQRTPATSPVNPNYTHVWTGTDGGPAVWINQWYYAGCRDTATRMSNVLSKAEGYLFGLTGYTDCADTTLATASVMNECYNELYTRAGAYPKDRNKLYGVMN